MLGIGDEPIPPPGPEARTGRASSENNATAVAARFMDFLLCRGLWTQLVQRQVWRSQESVRFRSNPTGDSERRCGRETQGGRDEIHAHVYMEARFEDTR